ncbi:fungal-specific transcription factor domain-containing protein [Pestalotiopsis sp. NC0098]|nr:fungal-specific transcription factor domain-containing protein [Pestalotiopsis sp. NC0098]
MGDIGFLSRSAMAEPRWNRYDRLPTNLTTQGVLSASLGLNGSDPSRASLSTGQAGKLVNSEPNKVRLDRTSTLPNMTRFVDEVCPIMPFLDAKQLMEQYEEVLEQHEGRSPTDTPCSSALSYFNVCLGVAIGAMLTSQSPSTSSLIVKLHQEAIKQLASIQLKDESNLVSCILILTLFSMYSPSGGSSWHLAGLAMRKCVSQGWHRQPDGNTQLTEDDLVVRKRLFWSAYMIDRSLSLVMDRPFTMQDRDITVPALKPTEATALHCHLVTQARLATDIQVNRRSALLHDYSNICFWRQWAAVKQDDAKTSLHVSDYLLQLECRMLAKVAALPADHQTLRTSSSSMAQEVERETVEACVRFVDQTYEQFQDHSFVGSFVDAYDLFSASLTIIQLKRRDVTVNTQLQLASMMDVINKCSALLTVVAERFSIFRSLQRVLLSLSGRLMTNSIPGAQITSNMEVELPDAIPDHLRLLISSCVD